MKKNLMVVLCLSVGFTVWSHHLTITDIIHFANRDYDYSKFKDFCELLELKKLEDVNNDGTQFLKYKAYNDVILNFQSNGDRSLVSYYTKSSLFFDRAEFELEKQGFNKEEHYHYKGSGERYSKVNVVLSTMVENDETYYILSITTKIAKNSIGELEEKGPVKTESEKLLEKRGIILRSQDYWDIYPGIGFTLQGIHNGDYPYPDGPLFSMLYLFFVKIYFQDCGHLLPEGSPGFETVTTTRFQDGSSMENVTMIVRMKPKFLKKYEEYANSYNPSMLDPELYRDNIYMLVDIQREVLEMYSREGCGSGFMRQFEENLHRIANRLKSVQEDSAIHEYTSDEPINFKMGRTLYSACLESIRKHSNAGPKDKKFCKCISEGYTPRITASELEIYIDDYRKLYKEKGNPPDEKNKNTWENYNIWAGCVNLKDR